MPRVIHNVSPRIPTHFSGHDIILHVRIPCDSNTSQHPQYLEYTAGSYGTYGEDSQGSLNLTSPSVSPPPRSHSSQPVSIADEVTDSDTTESDSSSGGYGDASEDIIGDKTDVYRHYREKKRRKIKAAVGGGPSRFRGAEHDDTTPLRPTHAADTLHHCPQCPKSYARADGLRRHIHTHHNHQRDHICPTCGQRFTQSSHLQKHRNTQHGDKGDLTHAEE